MSDKWPKIMLESWGQLLSGLVTTPLGWWYLLRAIVERLFMVVVITTINVLCRLFFKTKVIGKKNVPRQGRVALLLRHRSFIDPFLMEPALFWPWVLWHMRMFPMNVGKKRYFEKGIGWLFRWFAHWIRMVELPPKTQGKRSEVVHAVVKNFEGKDDCALILFATGTREEKNNKKLPAIMQGVGRVVAETLPQVVLVDIEGTQEFWPKDQTLPNFGRRTRVTIRISAAVDAADSTTRLNQVCHSAPLEEIGQPVADYLRDLFAAWLVLLSPELEEVEEPDYDRLLNDLWIIFH